MNVLRDLTNSIAVRIKLIAFSGFQKNSRFFLKNHFFSRRNQFFNVLRSLTILIASYNKFLILAISTELIFFSKNPYILFLITKFWRFREVLLFQWLFTASLLLSAFFLKKSFFLQKTQHVFPSKNLKFDFSTIFICSMPF